MATRAWLNSILHPLDELADLSDPSILPWEAVTVREEAQPTDTSSVSNDAAVGPAEQVPDTTKDVAHVAVNHRPEPAHDTTAVQSVATTDDQSAATALVEYTPDRDLDGQFSLSTRLDIGALADEQFGEPGATNDASNNLLECKAKMLHRTQKRTQACSPKLSEYADSLECGEDESAQKRNSNLPAKNVTSRSVLREVTYHRIQADVPQYLFSPFQYDTNAEDDIKGSSKIFPGPPSHESKTTNTTKLSSTDRLKSTVERCASGRYTDGASIMSTRPSLALPRRSARLASKPKTPAPKAPTKAAQTTGVKHVETKNAKDTYKGPAVDVPVCQPWKHVHGPCATRPSPSPPSLLVWLAEPLPSHVVFVRNPDYTPADRSSREWLSLWDLPSWGASEGAKNESATTGDMKDRGVNERDASESERLFKRRRVR
ncbi:hypothetical protein PHLGIDRAFT_120823 [Phlebiopsis gigantea 11061_1 CR5-6]|uniref:Uncharacterized protein n=1 Tax=Phlebiopsis gigantea (strain 11061_1 CR5-6) TaxID=745531 RepID=A0A0C3PFG4_PHLG1|nr:hypothetical protein PHLGIDRAFT_120823 [Phlebiopsis gigantea 11061_1 CR5-6]